FLFVKTPGDLYLYVFLLTFFELLGQLSMWLPARPYIGEPQFDLSYGSIKWCISTTTYIEKVGV
ncbi:hypothetical protein ACXOQL_09300, partial [Streptococcus thermophilus]|nr:hypothetical protein [Streptococcus thermophilus]